MSWIRVFLVVLLLLLLSCSCLLGGTIFYKVTPKNIHKDFPTLRVETKQYGDLIEFRFFAASDSNGLRGYRQGRFKIREGDKPILNCILEETYSELIKPHFWIQIDKRNLSGAYFFLEHFPSSMPSADVYEFELDEFVE